MDNNNLKIIITGATGMVGEGVLLECLANANVSQVLSIVRKPAGHTHPKLKELVLTDFARIEQVKDQLIGYDACFFCAGVSAVGMTEADYYKVTYGMTLQFAETLAGVQSDMVFNYVSGLYTDSTEKGKQMWARVKGKTENALMRLPFKHVYNFRPGMMKPTPGQQHIKAVQKILSSLYPVFRLLFPNGTSTLAQVGLAMINSVRKGYAKPILEVKDIKELASLK